MKKTIIIVCVAILLLGCGAILFGCGTNGNKQDDNGSTSGYEGEGGGNAAKDDNESNMKIISILVNEDQYFYNNNKITISEITELTKKLEADGYVEIKENNATHKAYNKLVKELNALDITIQEVN